MEYNGFDYEYEQMPNNMMEYGHGHDMVQCPYMRYLYSMDRHHCPYSENFDYRNSFDYDMPFLMPRIISVDIDELF
ncbi:hypothetical protein [Clostridium guangxiense]|uniref:hypothetical protein n=1 Tax=Clostridium guangxiense TaxID=1662055 RepID=UPI001E2E2FC7|nr:hypothetical protein [Clostridium guangxiense]MCD2346218.1 hypothetical protein [Clostridium guangxiense]